MNKCTSYGPDKLKLWPFYHLIFKCDLDLQPMWTNVSNGTSPSRRQQLCKIILKSMHKRTSYGPDKLNLWPFWPLFDPYDLNLQSTWKNVSNGIFPPQGQQLCKIILKSMNKSTSYGPHKLNKCIWPFWPLFDPVTLTFNLPEKMFQMALQGQQLCQIVLKSMHYCSSYGLDKSGRSTDIHWTKIVTVLCLAYPQAGSTKIWWINAITIQHGKDSCNLLWIWIGCKNSAMAICMFRGPPTG